MGPIMTDQTAPAALTRSHTSTTSGTSLIETVARKFHVSPFRQFAEMFRLKGGKTHLTGKEYYEFEVYRPNLTLAEKREFVGEKGSFELNLRLAPPNLTGMRNFLADKLGLTTLMGALGLSTTRIQAAYAPNRGFGTLPTLRTAAEVAAFLSGPAQFPLFGKPIRGGQAKGAVLIRSVHNGMATLGNGQTVTVAKLADEVAANVTFGYVFQDAVTQHPEIAAIAGSQTVSTVRVVTVNHSGRPEVLYTCWKLPSQGAMSDNFWQDGSLLSLVDPASGRVLKTRIGSGPATKWIDTHPITGAQLDGITLPCWQSVLDLAVAAHAVVPDNGVLGWDIAITTDGALLIECNENTGHPLYQLASGRGILNTDFTPVFDKVFARNTAILQAFAAKRKAHRKVMSAF